MHQPTIQSGVSVGTHTQEGLQETEEQQRKRQHVVIRFLFFFLFNSMCLIWRKEKKGRNNNWKKINVLLFFINFFHIIFVIYFNWLVKVIFEIFFLLTKSNLKVPLIRTWYRSECVSSAGREGEVGEPPSRFICRENVRDWGEKKNKKPTTQSESRKS